MESRELSGLLGFVRQNGGQIFLGGAVVRLQLERVLETGNRLIQPVKAHEHHAKIDMTDDMTGIYFERR